ncbi:MAG TPA: bifunctional riboflavin kinase/FAD synthetase [Persephonella sp.]|uniref:Riboflavin biosynthesis protein n=1 Tax=Persephonella marina (strain DSM 14350 / EX-H1) TaxID=123214 RepID=C0QSS7_PERMH|nr:MULTISPECIES: bifunctional riboflavin kinase/FAD synthetase [Persephonella]ACO03157.1 riboflavin biosynthesis protein RibF [Persephonella marina EX-H1]HCB70639.1 bifunctional riboflavin kinase/FAD synthetase [Persephonella sp.]
MKVITDRDLPLNEKTVCTIGSFDGFHKGHVEILNLVKKRAKEKNLRSLVITFDPHPKKFLNPDKAPCLITDINTKIDLLSRKSIDFVYVIKFDQNFLKKTADQFLRFLVEKLGCRHIIVGYDWRFGYMKEGDIEYAKRKSEELGFTIEVVDPIKEDGERISSTLIRSLLREGKIKEASKYLGRDYCIKGRIVKGDGKGKDLGFPTINIIPPPDLCLKKGVYAGYVSFNCDQHPAVINFGYRPTVDGKKLFIEAHVIDKNINPESEYVRIFFKEYIRPEKKFEDTKQLSDQIKEDIEAAKKIVEVQV